MNGCFIYNPMQISISNIYRLSHESIHLVMNKIGGPQNYDVSGSIEEDVLNSIFFNAMCIRIRLHILAIVLCIHALQFNIEVHLSEEFIII